MKIAVGTMLMMFLTMAQIGCGGTGTGGAPPPQTGGDSQNPGGEDPNAGVAFDQDLMQKGMDTK